MTLSCFKQLPLNSTLVLLPKKLNSGVILLLDVVIESIVSLDKPLDFQEYI